MPATVRDQISETLVTACPIRQRFGDFFAADNQPSTELIAYFNAERTKVLPRMTQFFAEEYAALAILMVARFGLVADGLWWLAFGVICVVGARLTTGGGTQAQVR